jgi:hypothetical protein
VQGDYLQLKEFQNFSEAVSMVFKKLPMDHRLLSTFFVDFSSNYFRTSTVTELNKSLDFLGRVGETNCHFASNFGLVMNNCQIRSE